VHAVAAPRVTSLRPPAPFSATAGPLSDAEIAEAAGDMDARLRAVGARHRVRMLLFRLVQELCVEHVALLGEEQVQTKPNQTKPNQTKPNWSRSSARSRFSASPGPRPCPSRPRPRPPRSAERGARTLGPPVEGRRSHGRGAVRRAARPCDAGCSRARGAQVTELLNLLGTAHRNAAGIQLEGERAGTVAQLGRLGTTQYLEWIYAECAESSRSELRFMFSVYAHDRGAAGAAGGALEARLLDRVVDVLTTYTGLPLPHGGAGAGAGAGAGGGHAGGPAGAGGREEAEPAARGFSVVGAEEERGGGGGGGGGAAHADRIRWILTPTLAVVLEGMQGLKQARFERMLRPVFSLLCALVECSDDARVRGLLSNLFLTKARPPPQRPSPRHAPPPCLPPAADAAARESRWDQPPAWWRS